MAVLLPSVHPLPDQCLLHLCWRMWLVFLGACPRPQLWTVLIKGAGRGAACSSTGFHGNQRAHLRSVSVPLVLVIQPPRPHSSGSEDAFGRHVLPSGYCSRWGVAPGRCFRPVSSHIRLIIDVSVVVSELFLWPLNQHRHKACRPSGCSPTSCWFLPCILFVSSPRSMWDLSCLPSYPKTLLIMNLQLNERCFCPVVWFKITLDGKTQARSYFSENINIEFVSALRVRIRTIVENRIAADMLLTFLVKLWIKYFF